MDKGYDFSGWATRYNLRCSDGRVIGKEAFKDCDGQKVPLIWNHNHDDVNEVVGYAILESRPEGMYSYGYCNDTDKGSNAKECIKHGDITSLSIYANHLKQKGNVVMHGAIKEVSLVLAGANPGAYIDNVIIHGEEMSDEAYIYSGEENITMNLEHADNGPEEKDDKTVQDVFDTLSEEQKTAVYFLITKAIEEASVKHSDTIQHSDDETVEDVYNQLDDVQRGVVDYMIEEAIKDALNEEETMKHNAFENGESENVLSHSDVKEVFDDIKRYGSLRESVLQHGITNIEYLFPDDKKVNNTPEFISRDMEWVSVVMNGVHHTPFSRIKSVFADITADEARAKGYIKGNEKTDEVFGLLKRSTTPQTVYKKQTLHRDDVIDITDFDVVAWLKAEMRVMLNEEIARAILIGDGRSSSSEDKIDETHIRPIWKDTQDNLYCIQKTITVSSSATDDQKAKAFIKAAIKSRKEYKGSGNPILFTTEDVLTDCLLMEDTQGRVIYDTEEKLRTALRVSKIVTVPVMENQTRSASGTTYTLLGLIVNLNDYNVGADKGGSVNMFDDFDIDYNAQKYLIETRCSGALIKPKSAIALELVFQ